jgi:hypothetical protein
MVDEENNTPIIYGNITWCNVSETSSFMYYIYRHMYVRKLKRQKYAEIKEG